MKIEIGKINSFKVQGVYAIFNQINCKIYVGHSHLNEKYNGIGERLYDHVRKLKKWDTFQQASTRIFLILITQILYQTNN